MIEKQKYKIKFLVRFLKEKNAYSRYRHNLFLEKGYYSRGFLKTYMNGGILSNAFVWRTTKEGYEYWKELHYEFLKKYYEAFDY